METAGINGFGERLAEAIGAESVNAFAKRCEVSEGSIRNYLRDKVPGADIALKIADTSGVSFEWLVSGRGAKHGTYEPDFVVRGPEGMMMMIETKQDHRSEVTIVPRLEVDASAGGGAVATAEHAIDLVAFQSAWLRALGISPSFARVINAKGDSMELTIRDGDLLLVDTSVSQVRDNGIYCVIYGNMLLVKRIHVRLNGSLQLISDNAIYPPEEVTSAEAEQLSIAGRVMWFGRSI